MEYLQAYTVTNEDLRWTTAQFPDAKRVLTVAGGGDQALFHILGGATHVDTFDITHYAHAIQDIKLTAMQLMDYDAWFGMIDRIYNKPAAEIDRVPHMADVMVNMPDDSYKILNQARARNDRPFGNGLRISSYKDNTLNADEYARLKQMKLPPFKFILSNVTELHTKLTGEYDLINLSNILDYLPTDVQEKVLYNLAPHVKPGGYIIHTPQNHNYDYRAVRATNGAATLEYNRTIQNNPKDRWDKIIAFQRTR